MLSKRTRIEARGSVWLDVGLTQCDVWFLFLLVRESFNILSLINDPSRLTVRHSIFDVCISGLHGIELGTQMIRTVGTKIRSDFPNITKFSSLSPIPGFRDYLLTEIQSVARGDTKTVSNFIKDDEMKELAECLLRKSALYNAGKNLIGDNDKNMWRILAGEIRSNRWFNDEQLVRLLRVPLMRKCAHYLYGEKRRAYALNAVGKYLTTLCQVHTIRDW